ncbi:hypothetical protein L1987_35548 [Smallanthus sonchifolius]|uniref:Uncharacterized protein n=1 Tax=Smallanthus sonchifolius TaxID=185202 RepID=A0ACB9HXE3_9ASTR|nr:hypothetical protein L1987_35548 [Smallanthus sonchifolius]
MKAALIIQTSFRGYLIREESTYRMKDINQEEQRDPDTCQLSPQQKQIIIRLDSSPHQQLPSSISTLKVHSSSPRSQRELSAGKPSYMCATASAMARIRPQRQRLMSATEGEKHLSMRKRLSFEKYNIHGGDSELDRNPIDHTMERRLSMSSCCKQR